MLGGFSQRIELMKQQHKGSAALDSHCNSIVATSPHFGAGEHPNYFMRRLSIAVSTLCWITH